LQTYLAALFDSTLPFPPWGPTLLWAVLFLLNHQVVKLARVANNAQRGIVIEDWNALRQGSEPKYIFMQVLVAVLGFTLAFLLGGAGYTFFAGGLIIQIGCVLSLNLQALLTARSMARPDAGTGTFTFSTPAAFRQLAHRVFSIAIAALFAGLVTAHLALLGGAALLGVTASGLYRKARKLQREG
jgi:hypothetical protein